MKPVFGEIGRNKRAQLPRTPRQFPDVPEQRRRIMRQIKGRNTHPELLVRSKLHRAGYRFLVNVKKLPGHPDLAFIARRRAIFVHGCFWHLHSCEKGRLPKTRQSYWQPKLEGNRRRDAASELALTAMGWRWLTVWECELGDPTLLDRLQSFLGPPKLQRRSLTAMPLSRSSRAASGSNTTTMRARESG
jgi:DNA mismatch endonuclease (patch repair protein)